MSHAVIGNVSLFLDGRTAGAGGEYDMSWIAPLAVTDGAREHMTTTSSPATTIPRAARTRVPQL